MHFLILQEKISLKVIMQKLRLVSLLTKPEGIKLIRHAPRGNYFVYDDTCTKIQSN